MKRAEEREFKHTIKTDGRQIYVRTKYGCEVIAYTELFSIEYIQKRLLFHMQDKKEVLSRTIRAPMEDVLKDLMRNPYFVRVHRAFIINIEKAIHFEQQEILMEDGSRIPLSRKRRKETLEIWGSMDFGHPRTAHANAAVKYCEEHAAQLELLRMQPIANCIIRVDVDDHGVPYDFVFMFVNDELCKLEGKTEEVLLGASFYDIFSNADPKWLSYYWQTAYQGISLIFESFSPEIDCQIKVVCYPVSSGYCGCILVKLEEGQETGGYHA